MIYAVDPPDCSNHRGKGQPPILSRTMWGPVAELEELEATVPFRAKLVEPVKAEGLAYVTTDHDEALMANPNVVFVHRYDLSKIIAGKPLNEVA